MTLCFFAINCSSNSAKVIEKRQQIEPTENAININKASSEDLEKLPQVGAKTAEKIIKYRRRFGKFRRPEHLMLVGGISDKEFRNMRSLIKVK